MKPALIALLLAACSTTPPCERPALEPEYRIDWNEVRSVEYAKVEHERFVSVMRVREGQLENSRCAPVR